MRPIQPPTETTDHGPGGMEQTVSKHPAYGQISVYHGHGGGRDLYGSDFEHHNTVTLRICASELRRDLNHDWHFARREFIEVEMSEVQYAAMVGSPNRGDGVPCTIRSVDGELIPGLPRRDTTHIYSEEVAAKIANTLTELKRQRAKMAASVASLSKVKQQEFLGAIDKAIQEIEANLPFVVKSFNEHVESSIEKAKVEVEAYVTNTIHRTGLSVLRGAAVPQLEKKS